MSYSNETQAVFRNEKKCKSKLTHIAFSHHSNSSLTRACCMRHVFCFINLKKKQSSCFNYIEKTATETLINQLKLSLSTLLQPTHPLNK